MTVSGSSCQARPTRRRRAGWPISVTIGLVAAGTLMAPAAGQTDPISRISVGYGNVESNAESFDPKFSRHGRWVAFAAFASNLVADDVNGVADVFVRDRRTRVTQLVSVAPDGSPANGDSFRPVLSASGRFVAFMSFASNLVRGDTNDQADIFMRDRRHGKTYRVSVGSRGKEADGESMDPVISPDGRFVAFMSLASNLVADDTNAVFDVFVHDRRAGTTDRVSRGIGGGQGSENSFSPSMSDNGRFVAFMTNSALAIADTNAVRDIYVRDRWKNTTTRVSVGAGGRQGDDGSFWPAISGDGTRVAFDSFANNLVSGDTNPDRDVFVRDLTARTTWIVSVARSGGPANGGSERPALSADGRVVAFTSFATNLVPGTDTNESGDVFTRAGRTGAIRLQSTRNGRQTGNSESFGVSLSPDGRQVGFNSFASDLVADDRNDLLDVFVRSR